MTISNDQLIIVDAQYGFIETTQRRLISNLVGLTKQFIKFQNNIIILEYIGCGLTLSAITEHTVYYSKASIIGKNFESGTPKILKNSPDLAKLGLTFHVAGVNWNQCVFKTIRDLLIKTNGKVVAHRYASNPYFRRCDKIWDDLIAKYNDRLEIIKRK